MLSAFGFRNLWHGILPQQLSQTIFNEGQDGNKWVQKLILLILRSHNELWRFHCEVVHAAIMGNEYVESILWLHRQISTMRNNGYYLIPDSLNATKQIELMDASQLRGWLYSFYAHNDMWDAYELVHT